MLKFLPQILRDMNMSKPKRQKRLKGCNRHRQRDNKRGYDKKRVWLYTDTKETEKEKSCV